jgi:phosphatidylglycerophosphate synthase
MRMAVSLKRQIPNTLSTLRLLLGFCFPVLPPAMWLPVIVIALLSEFFDGYFARRFNAISPLGQMLDPIADKIFILATILILISEGRLTGEQLLLIAARDIVAGLGSIPVIIKNWEGSFQILKPRISGKITTALQFTLMIWLYAPAPFPTYLLRLTIIASLISAADYAVNFLRLSNSRMHMPDHRTRFAVRNPAWR